MSISLTRKARLAEVALPDLGLPDAVPEIPATVYAARLDRLRGQMEVRGYDHVVVYADREHSANLSYLTGFDPRFEEAILVVGRTAGPAILVDLIPATGTPYFTTNIEDGLAMADPSLRAAFSSGLGDPSAADG